MNVDEIPVIYHGRRSPCGVVVWRNNQLFTHEESLKVRSHSPSGFNWGYQGSGPAQLALALLLDTCGPQRRWYACDLYQRFKFNVVCKWADAWILPQKRLIEFITVNYPNWLAEAMPGDVQMELDMCQEEPTDKEANQ